MGPLRASSLARARRGPRSLSTDLRTAEAAYRITLAVSSVEPSQRSTTTLGLPRPWISRARQRPTRIRRFPVLTMERGYRADAAQRRGAPKEGNRSPLTLASPRQRHDPGSAREGPQYAADGRLPGGTRKLASPRPGSTARRARKAWHSPRSTSTTGGKARARPTPRRNRTASTTMRHNAPRGSEWAPSDFKSGRSTWATTRS